MVFVLVSLLKKETMEPYILTTNFLLTVKDANGELEEICKMKTGGQAGEKRPILKQKSVKMGFWRKTIFKLERWNAGWSV